MSPVRAEAEAVCVVCLVELLAPIIEQERRRDFTKQRETSAGVLATLSREAAVPPRRLYAILNREQTTVGLGVADRLLCALDRPDLVQQLEVFIRPHGRTIGYRGEHTGCPRQSKTSLLFAAARRPELAQVESTLPSDSLAAASIEREAA